MKRGYHRKYQWNPDDHGETVWNPILKKTIRSRRNG
jgi:hypothetical protein